MGLGRYPLISIREARTKAFEFRKQIEDGLDPIEARRREGETEEKINWHPHLQTGCRDLAWGSRYEF